MTKNLMLAALATTFILSTAAAVLFYQLAALPAPSEIGDARPELHALESNAAWHQLVETLRRANEALIGDGPNGAPSEQHAINRF